MARTSKPGIVTTIKELVLKDPAMPVDDVLKNLRKKGYRKPSRNTVISFRQDFLHSLRFLRDKGLVRVEGI